MYKILDLNLMFINIIIYGYRLVRLTLWLGKSYNLYCIDWVLDIILCVDNSG